MSGPSPLAPPQGKNEEYGIRTDFETEKGFVIEIEAQTFAGVVRALQTLRQLGGVYDVDGQRRFLLSGPFSLNDSPKLAYRGLLIDTGRSFLRYLQFPNLHSHTAKC